MGQSTYLDTYQLELTFKTYNINHEKIDLYYDFLISLDTLINKTFLGIDVIYTYNDILNHFTWCFNKIIESFEKENIFFKRKGTLFNYLWLFYYDGFYMTLVENGEVRVIQFFITLFDMSIKKTRPELKIIIDIYSIFEENLIRK